MSEDIHADYPHTPGSLWDCAACEENCYCRPGQTMCVHCELQSERELNKRTIRYIDRFTY